jgi:hypothetical protein
VGGISTKKMLQATQRNINSPEFIANRYKYVRRYLDLTEDKTADICFMG